ncbi:hypothetical protein SRB5_61230 [Streptomyces sp. RB5]|uniref:Extensin n=1 Tax=Streptomyces smaragdinus TaxID=2585196 RepID=A0A7K0CR88_9ACTN|nr:hypothetical protein [Streptomyces smaragdinus]MQY15931.1 hypothetical protein [Streptomyces smaragdinus]
MAEKPLGWLDEDAAEHLLRGESVLPSPGTARDVAEAERLAAFLATLADTGRRYPDDAYAPGQEAAVAAFRAARRETSHGFGTALFALVRRIRPLRAAAAVTLLACTAGGMAVASTAGLSPFTDTPAKPPATVSPLPGTSMPAAGGSATPGNDSSPSADPDGHRSGDPDNSGPGPDAKENSGKDATPPPSAAQLEDDCRAFVTEQTRGERPDRETMNRLNKAAGGTSKIGPYCDGLLGSPGGSTADESPDGPATASPDSTLSDPNDGPVPDAGSPTSPDKAVDSAPQDAEPAAGTGETTAPTAATD